MKTSSRLGLSGAPRTSSTVNPAPTRDSATSDRLRKRRTESETTVVPGSRKTTCWRKATNAMATSISSVQLFTNPTLGDQPAERSGLGSMHASLRRLGHESRRHESTTREEPRAVLLEVTTRHLRSRRPEPHCQSSLRDPPASGECRWHRHGPSAQRRRTVCAGLPPATLRRDQRL